jgi:predicted amidohydrolase YtcJ
VNKLTEPRVFPGPRSVTAGESDGIRFASSITFDNATLWRGPSAEPARCSLTVTAGIIAAMNDDTRPEEDGAVRVEMEGLHIVPGFVDSHSHLSVGAWVPWFADGARWASAAHALSEVRRAAGLRAQGWILAFNVDEDAWPDGVPTAADLESAAPGRAVMLVHLSLHRAILSETALRTLAISRSTHDPMGDVEKGRGGAPTGRVWESVFGHAVTTALLETARGLEASELDALLDAEAERHLAAGITACHDPCIPEALLSAMTRLAARTPLRVSWSHVSAHGILEAPMLEIAHLPGGDGPASAKLFLDGAHRCALCLDPRQAMAMAGRAVTQLVARGNARPLRELMRYRTVYKRPHFHLPYLRFTDDDLVERICEYGERGVRAKIHALGNEAVAQACRALRRSGVRNASIEHLLILSDREVEAVVESGCVASLQPGFIPHYGASLIDRGIAGRLKTIPIATLLRAGVPVALSSDYPCGPLDPLVNIREAIERRVPDGRSFDAAEAVSASQAVAAYSIGGAHCVHGKPGEGLSTGALADFAVLSGPPGARETRVLRTWVGGSEVWRAPGERVIGEAA